MSWVDFENELLKEFKAILSHFNEIKDEINEDIRKDFLSLLQYTIKSRSSFRSIAGSNYDLNDNDFKNLELDPNSIAEELLTKDLDSFAPEYSNFPLILNKCVNVPEELLIKLCIKYWKRRYPSIKTSFIIPLCAKIPKLLESKELKSLLVRRILKGKLTPFDESIQICKILEISPEDTDFHDPQLAALKDLLRNHQQLQIEQTCGLKQTGCHCD